MNKFEKLIEFIINDEDQKARELFHTIVVEKSRDIYESIMDEEVAGQPVEEFVNNMKDEEAMEGEEEFSADGEETGDEEFGAEEPTDDVEAEFGSDAEEGDTEEHAEIEDKVMNIDAKLDELLAKFDEIMGDDGHGEEMPAMHDEMGSDEGHEEEPAVFEAEEEEEEEEEEESGNPFAKKDDKKKTAESRKSTSELMREYVDRIGDIYGGQGDAAEGDAVGSSGKKTSVNTKPGSVGPGADFGGTTATPKGGEQNQDGTSAPSAPKPQEIKSGNRNVPGGKADTLAKGPTAKSGEESAVNDKPVQKQNTGKK